MSEQLTLTETVLQEAQRLVHTDRGTDYGHPLDDFTKTAEMFNAWRGTKLTADDVAVFMVFVKLSREANKHKRDNLVDVCGYAQTLMMVKEERARRERLADEMQRKPELDDRPNKPPVSFKEERMCATCQYLEVNEYKPPCIGCLGTHGDANPKPNWTPMDAPTSPAPSQGG
jgi:hypothetical protein